jgi:hypothetical protein
MRYENMTHNSAVKITDEDILSLCKSQLQIVSEIGANFQVQMALIYLI